MANSSYILELRNINAGYGEIQVLKDVCLQVKPGQILSVLGANGAGKSTLLKSIFGMVRPSQGQVLFEGQDIGRQPTVETLKRGIAYVPEGRSNFPGMSVEDNLEMAATVRTDRRQVLADIDALCKRFPILQQKRRIEAGNLSGGQQQMLEIAMGLMLKPKLILIDEPTLGLAPILVSQVFEIIKEINASGTTVVLVEQNAKRALEISHYAFVLELGRIRFEGTAADLSSHEEVVQAYLGER